MKVIMIFLAVLFFPVASLLGQSEIQKYAGTAMPYPSVKELPILNHEGMMPFILTIWEDMEHGFQLRERH